MDPYWFETLLFWNVLRIILTFDWRTRIVMFLRDLILFRFSVESQRLSQFGSQFVSLKQWLPQKIVLRFFLRFALPFTGTQNTVCEIHKAANMFLQLLPIPPTLYMMHIYFHIILEAQNNHTVFKGITVPPQPQTLLRFFTCFIRIPICLLI